MCKDKAVSHLHTSFSNVKQGASGFTSAGAKLLKEINPVFLMCLLNLHDMWIRDRGWESSIVNVQNQGDVFSSPVPHFIAFPGEGFLLLTVHVNPCVYFPRGVSTGLYLHHLKGRFAFTSLKLTVPPLGKKHSHSRTIYKNKITQGKKMKLNEGGKLSSEADSHQSAVGAVIMCLAI